MSTRTTTSLLRTALLLACLYGAVVGSAKPVPSPVPSPPPQFCFGAVCFPLGKNTSQAPIVVAGSAAGFTAPGYNDAPDSFVTLETLYQSLLGVEFGAGYALRNLTLPAVNATHVRVIVTVTPLPGWPAIGCLTNDWVGPLPPGGTYVPASWDGCLAMGVNLSRTFTANASGILLPAIWAPSSLVPTLAGGVLAQPQLFTLARFQSLLAGAEPVIGKSIGIVTNITLTARPASRVTLDVVAAEFNASAVLPPKTTCDFSALARGNSSGIYVAGPSAKQLWVPAAAFAGVVALLESLHGKGMALNLVLIPVKGSTTSVVLCQYSPGKAGLGGP